MCCSSVGVGASVRFGVVSVDIYRNAIGAQGHATGFGSIFFTVVGSLQRLVRAVFFAASDDDLRVENFTGAMLGARDESQYRLLGQVCANVLPGLGGIVDQLAVLQDLGSQSTVPVGRGEGVFRTVDVRGK